MLGLEYADDGSMVSLLLLLFASQEAHRQAVQNQEKRLATRLQQEQRGRQREQNRQLRRKLMESQALNRQQQQTILKVGHTSNLSTPQ